MIWVIINIIGIAVCVWNVFSISPRVSPGAYYLSWILLVFQVILLFFNVYQLQTGAL